MESCVKKLLLSLIVTLITVNAYAFDPVSPDENFQMTNFDSMEQLNRYWRTMKGKRWLRSEGDGTNCYDRAHVWSYELFRDYQVKSKKIIIHYSAKYMDELDDGWSWHVAPMVTLNGQEMVLDKLFMDEPVTKEAWLAHFTKFAKDRLEYKRRDILTEISNAQWKIDRIRQDKGRFWWPSISSLRRKIYKKQRELRSWGLSADRPAEINCKPISHIEEMDYPTLTYKEDEEKNRTRIEWCYVQTMSMYYHGLPQLRLLNYGDSRMSRIPYRRDLDAARRAGANHQQHDFDMMQVWDAIERAFDKPEKRFRREYYINKRLEDRD